MNAPELKTGQMVTIAYFVGILVVLFIIYKILAATGLIKTAAKKNQEKKEVIAEEALRTSEYFDTMFLKGKTGFTPLGDSLGNKLANDLRTAMRGLGTDEEVIYATFGKVKSKYGISELSLRYYVLFKRDLLTDLLNELTDEEQLTLFNIIDKLPLK